MRIKFLSGPRAGEISHAERTQSTQLLIDAGLIEVVNDALPAPPVPQWLVSIGMSGNAHVRCNIGPRVEIYDGPPQHVVSAFKKIGLVVPEDIAAKYASKFAPLKTVGADGVALGTAIRHGANDNRQFNNRG